MGHLDFLSNDFDNFDAMDSASYLEEYQQNAIIGRNKEPDYNYEYDRFPKNFKFTKNFMGIPTNPEASKLDKFYTETYLTNKVRNIEDIYLGSKEASEEISREILPQDQSYLITSAPKNISAKCSCNKCQGGVIKEYMDKQNVNRAIEELQKKNEILTIMLIFIAIYCIIQIFYQPRGYSIVSETSSTYAKPAVSADAVQTAAETITETAA